MMSPTVVCARVLLCLAGAAASTGALSQALRTEERRLVLNFEDGNPLRRQSQELIEPLRQRVAAHGQIRVIVGLNFPESNTQTRFREALHRDVAAFRSAAGRAKAEFRRKYEPNGKAPSQWDYMELDLIPYVTLVVDEAVLARLIRDDSIASITTESTGVDILNATIPHIGASSAHAIGYNGSSYAVAVIDSGLSLAHPMFSGKVIAQACFSTSQGTVNGTTCAAGLPNGSTSSGAGGLCRDNRVNGTPGTNCNEWHGTHVSGIAAGSSQTFASTSPSAPSPHVPFPLEGARC